MAPPYDETAFDKDLVLAELDNLLNRIQNVRDKLDTFNEKIDTLMAKSQEQNEKIEDMMRTTTLTETWAGGVDIAASETVYMHHKSRIQ
jgi:hypothetical protein